MIRGLARFFGSIAAAVLIAQLLSWTIQSGIVQAAVSHFNPEDPRRQLERSLTAAIRQGHADVIVVGHTEFVSAVQRTCRLEGEVVGINIDRAGWREFDFTIAYLLQLEPSLFVLQGRSFLWTDLLNPWRLQYTNLLPRDAEWDWLPLTDVRTAISAVNEIIQGRPSPSAKGSGIPSLIGARFDLKLANRFMARIDRALARQRQEPSGILVVDELDIPDDAMPETREQIILEVERPPRLPTLKLESATEFSQRFSCDKERLHEVALQMRQRPGVVGNVSEEDDDAS